MIEKTENNLFPLLAGKKNTIEGGIYLCRNYTCKTPVSTVEELIKLIEGK
jgi:uncharacterized protein YyaL (SSP411 family)